jgi:hypothetical protein
MPLHKDPTSLDVKSNIDVFDEYIKCFEKSSFE